MIITDKPLFKQWGVSKEPLSFNNYLLKNLKFINIEQLKAEKQFWPINDFLDKLIKIKAKEQIFELLE